MRTSRSRAGSKVSGSEVAGSRDSGIGTWGSLNGGLGTCIVFGGTLVGAIGTVLLGDPPGFVLGFFVVAGTVAAALGVRPNAGRLIIPVPALSYLIAAFVTGMVYDRSADTSKTAIAIHATQWIADGFFAMALATAIAVVLTAIRWYIWFLNRRRTAAADARSTGDRLDGSRRSESGAYSDTRSPADTRAYADTQAYPGSQGSPATQGYADTKVYPGAEAYPDAGGRPGEGDGGRQGQTGPRANYVEPGYVEPGYVEPGYVEPGQAGRSPGQIDTEHVNPGQTGPAGPGLSAYVRPGTGQTARSAQGLDQGPEGPTAAKGPGRPARGEPARGQPRPVVTEPTPQPFPPKLFRLELPSPGHPGYSFSSGAYRSTRCFTP